MSQPIAENLPQYCQKRGVYYGWVVLIVGTLGIIMSIPGQTMGVSVFTESLIENLSIDRTQLSLAYLLGTLSSSFILPYIGRLLDRLGVRLMGVIASLGLAFSLLLLAQSPWLTKAIGQSVSLAPEWTAFVFLFFAFLGIRHFGQGQLTLISRTMMGRWFDRFRGRVLGISGLFVAFGFGIAPLFLNNLIQTLQWQTALMWLAFTLVLMAGVAWLFFRNSPEESGVPLDGISESPLDDHPEKRKTQLKRVAMTVEQARRTLAFWIFNLGMVAQAMLITAVTFHMAKIGELSGIPANQAFALFLPVAVVSTISDLIGGYVSDRVPLKYLLAVMQLGLCLGLLSLNAFGTTWGFLLTATGFGISGGLFSLLTGATWPKLFGRLHLGAISGFSMAFIVCGSAIGPYLFSVIYDWQGGFQWAFTLSAIFPALIFLSSFKADPPIEKLVEPSL